MLIQPNRRSGIAAVELAVCLPVLLLLVFGGLELANGIYLKQAATSAAYETARIISAPGALETTAKYRGQEVLSGFNIVDGEIAISPPIDESVALGTPIVVTATIPTSSNSGRLSRLLSQAPVTASVTMVKQ
jgi:Flp pilus assembly protein TadG